MAKSSSERLNELSELAGQADHDPVWPAQSWNIVRDLGGTRWAIPAEYGGDGLEAADLLQHYEALAAACLTTCFILSQRDAAVRRLGELASADLRRELLPALAQGDTFATVGLSQLTTSHQHGKPPVLAELTENGIIIDGVIPWVTGAVHADYLIAGAALHDGNQILVVVPTKSAGVTVGAALDLMALEGSCTAEVPCAAVHLERRWLLAGPAPQIMKSARGGTGGLETSCLALGLAGAALQHVQAEAQSRPDLRDDADRLASLHERIRRQLYELAQTRPTAEAAQNLRAAANALALQAGQTALAVSKGTGFLRNHPAQRWARQAMFFLVWSCPRPVAAATVDYILSAGDGICL